MAAEWNSTSSFPDENIFIENIERRADDRFIDDLIAANDMKAYILAAGHDLADHVIADLNLLYSTFRSDIEARRAKPAGIAASPDDSRDR